MSGETRTNNGVTEWMVSWIAPSHFWAARYAAVCKRDLVLLVDVKPGEHRDVEQSYSAVGEAVQRTHVQRRLVTLIDTHRWRH